MATYRNHLHLSHPEYTSQGMSHHILTYYNASDVGGKTGGIIIKARGTRQ